MQICESQMLACNRQRKSAKAKNCLVFGNADLRDPNAGLQTQLQS